MKNVLALFFLVFAILVQSLNVFAFEALDTAKKQLVERARLYTGLGDPDFRIQNELEPLVQMILTLSPQPPVKERIDLLVGSWQQIWGPYEYRNDDRGVDRRLKTDEIYQRIFKEGYYYNVSPNFTGKGGEYISLLKGVYSVDKKQRDLLNVSFRKLTRLNKRPTDKEIWDLPPLSEAGTLENEIKSLPNFFVRLFFEGGSLQEVYTDEDLRILYATNNQNFKRPYLYVMVRVK
jgi:hypothetical protein